MDADACGVGCSRSFYYLFCHIGGIEITVKMFAGVFSTCDFELAVLKTRKGNEFNIVAKILRVAAKGSKEEEIMDRCKLDRVVLENYLSALAELRLVSVEEKGETFYRTTKKGLELLRVYHRLRWLLWGGDDDFLLMRLLGQVVKVKRVKRDVHPFYVS